MSFFGSILDSLPVVGHVKGVIHYATGDTEAGNKSMYQATRTTAVLGAGAVGSLAGPGGAVAAAVYAGAATDTVASVAMDKPQGIVKGCENIGQDIAAGRNPTGSIVNTGFQVAMDGVGGLGMGGVSSAASQISEKAVVKTVENVAKKTVATVGEKTVQKTLQISGEQAVKAVTKRVTEETVKTTIKVVAANAEAVLVSVHVARQARESAEEEQREQRERRDRERDRERREQRAREEREQRAREEREQRAREEREQRAREEREQRAREERERQAREYREQRAREESEQRAREEREQRAREERAIEEREQRAREEREQRARVQREQQAREYRERRAREESEQRAREEREQLAREEREQRTKEEREQRAKEETEQLEVSESSSDFPEPPEKDQNNKKKTAEEIEYLFSLFISLLENQLDLIFGKKETHLKQKIRDIFKKLKDGQIRYLVTIIERIQNDGILEEVVKLVIMIFKEHFPNDISFLNFLSLLEFVSVYMMNEIKDRTLLFRMSERETRRNNSTPRMRAAELRAMVISCIMDLTDLVQKIFDVFVTLRHDIKTETAAPNTISPNFRDLFSAVYHYFKHRYVKGYGVFSVKEYFDWIRLVLEKLRNQQRYSDLLNDQRTRNVNANVRFEIYFNLFGRRIRMIVKFQGRDLVLSSCFVVDDENDDDGDEDGKVWLVIRRF